VAHATVRLERDRHARGLERVRRRDAKAVLHDLVRVAVAALAGVVRGGAEGLVVMGR
jgi:hypothetical protein